MENQGTISLRQFKKVLEDNYKVNSAEAEQIFAALDTDHDNTICYSEFLAAVLQTRVRMHEDLLRKTFARFDQDGSGIITVDDLRKVLGDTFGDVALKELIAEADADGNGSIDYEEFLQYLQKSGMDNQSGTDCDEPSSDFYSDNVSLSKAQRQKRCVLAGQLIDRLVPDASHLPNLLPLTPLSQVARRSVLGCAKHEPGTTTTTASLFRTGGA